MAKRPKVEKRRTVVRVTEPSNVVHDHRTRRPLSVVRIAHNPGQMKLEFLDDSDFSHLREHVFDDVTLRGKVLATLEYLTVGFNRRPPPPDLSQALGLSQRVFEMTALVLPRRLAMEDLGDAQEALAALAKSGCPAWKLRVKILSTVFWLAIKTIREVVAGLTGRKTGS